MIKHNDRKHTTTLAGGCFWCLEAVYDELRGVSEVVSGYSGGALADPSYEEVCGGETGHAEVVQITFDTEIVNFKNLLEIFFTIHDPTTLNQQGSDYGTQYRSAIFYHNDEQKRIAEVAIQELADARVWIDPIVTEIIALDKFYEAEDYHQKYFQKNPLQPYCRVIVRPKVAKFRKKYMDKLKTKVV